VAFRGGRYEPKDEVQAILEVRLDHFLDPKTLGAIEIDIPGVNSV